MTKLEEIKKTLSNHKKELEERFKVKEIGIFGSYVRKEQRSTSDIDILVEFKETPGLFEFIELKNYLSKLLGKTVDLVMKRALKPTIGKNILKEVVMI